MSHQLGAVYVVLLAAHFAASLQGAAIRPLSRSHSVAWSFAVILVAVSAQLRTLVRGDTTMNRSRFALGMTACMLMIAAICQLGWGQDVIRPADAHVAAAELAINEQALRGHIRFLADDLLEGRGPGSRGDELAQRYIAAQFESLGLKPSAPEGGWVQRVPLVGVTTHVPARLKFQHAANSLELKRHDDYVITSGKAQPKVDIQNAEIVFVGYGIQAAEYQWDDFKGADLRGKILLVMNNDPADDPELFAGKRRLYYGRWDYKYDSAARQGAAGAIIIHTTASAGYPLQVVQTSWSGEEFELEKTAGPRLDMRGWFTEDASRRLVSLAGHDLDKLRAAAERRDFKPVPLGVSLSLALTCDVRKQQTGNVLGLLPGSDPALAQQTVVFMAHHDHLGLAAERNAAGDNIYNGAVDNASGTAALLAIARACSSLPKRPARSILFAAVGAEEQGLLGSLYLAEHPPLPAGNLAAVINIDGVNIIGPTRDVNVIGLGKSNLDELVGGIARWQNRVATPDEFPDRGYYYRSDQFSLAKIGVPGVYLHSGVNVIGKPEGWGKQQLEAWTQTKYHQPSDEYSDDWDLRGAVDDTRLLFYVGLQAADRPDLPRWNPGDEFEAARKAALEALKK
jgi:Zn-dependent M28 family amino/carboxypeptidase